jgi:YVTN family beta-propeller protein
MSSPTITNISPGFGPFSGETQVTITGTGFTNTADTTVLFGGSAASAVRVISATQLTAVSPASVAGGVGCSVTVENSNGVNASGENNLFCYYPLITSVTDATGTPVIQAQPGSLIVINGSGFGTVGASIPFAGGMTIVGVQLYWSSSMLSAASSDPSMIFGTVCKALSAAQVSISVPPYSNGKWWIAVGVNTAFPNSQGQDAWPNSNFLPLTIATLPPGPSPTIANVTDGNGNLLSTSANGNVYVTAPLLGGQTIIIKGTNFGATPGFLYYQASTGLTVGVSGNLGATDWLDFTEYCTIVRWTDSGGVAAVTLRLRNTIPSPNDSLSFQIALITARTATNSGVWSNFLLATVTWPPTYPLVTGVADQTGKSLLSAQVNTYVILQGQNFGAAPGTVEWWTPGTLGDGSLGSLVASHTYVQGVDDNLWSNTAIVALTPTPPQVLAKQQRTGPSRGQFFVRVVDSNGYPNATVLPGTPQYDQNAYPLTLIPPPIYVYVVNSGDNSVSVIDAAALQVVKTVYLGLPTQIGGAGSTMVAVPMGIAANAAGTKVYVAIQVWKPQQSSSQPGASSTWPGLVGFVPVEGYVAVIQSDASEWNWGGVIGWYPTGVSPQGIAVSTPADSSKPYDYFLYVANVGSPGAFPGDGSVVALDNSKFIANPTTASSAGVLATIQSKAPTVGQGNPTPGIQSPLTLALSPDGTRLYVLDGGTLYNTSAPSNYLLVIDTEVGSPSLHQVTATVQLPVPSFQVQDMVLAPDGSRLYIAVRPSTAQGSLDGSLSRASTVSPYVSVVVVDTTKIQPGLNNATSQAVYATLQINVPGASASPTITWLTSTIAPVDLPSTILRNCSVPVANSGNVQTAWNDEQNIAQAKLPSLLIQGNSCWMYGPFIGVSGDAVSMSVTQMSGASGVIETGAIVALAYSPPSPPSSASTQQIGIGYLGEPTFEGLYTSVVAQGIGISSDGGSLYVSDLFGPVWEIDLNQVSNPGKYGPPQWSATLLTQQPGVSVSGYNGPYGTNVAAAINVQGLPNSVVVSPTFAVYVAQGGLSASAHEVLPSASVVGLFSQIEIPQPGNAVTVFPPSGAEYSIPTPFLTNVPGVPATQTNIPVGHSPIALCVAQPFPTPAPPTLPTGSSAGGLSQLRWWGWWRRGEWPIFTIHREPQLQPVEDMGASRWPRNKGASLAGSFMAIDWPITRAQLASVLMQILKLQKTDSEESFVDLSPRSWALPAAQVMIRYMKLPMGTSDRNFFLPYAVVSRQECARIVLDVLAARGRLRTLSRADVDRVLKRVTDAAEIAEALRNSVGTLLHYSLMRLVTDNQFNPRGPLRCSHMDSLVSAIRKLN